MKNKISITIVVGGIIVGYLWMEQAHMIKNEHSVPHVEFTMPLSGSSSA